MWIYLHNYIDDDETTTEDQYTTVTYPVIETTMVTKSDFNAASESLF